MPVTAVTRPLLIEGVGAVYMLLGSVDVIFLSRRMPVACAVEMDQMRAGVTWLYSRMPVVFVVEVDRVSAGVALL